MVRSRWAAVNRNCRIASQSSTERRSRENDADPQRPAAPASGLFADVYLAATRNAGPERTAMRGPSSTPTRIGTGPGQSALQAVGVCRERCWWRDLIIDLDIKAFLASSTQYPCRSLRSAKRVVAGGRVPRDGSDGVERDRDEGEEGQDGHRRWSGDENAVRRDASGRVQRVWSRRRCWMRGRAPACCGGSQLDHEPFTAQPLGR
jgi:hypothetical protein